MPHPVLLIEDHPGDVELILHELRHAGRDAFAASAAPSLAAALPRLRGEAWAIVLLDLSLPDARGLATLRAVREAAPGTPIVVLTGHDDEELALQAVREGAQDYLVKGQVSGPVLVRALRYAIERQRADDAERARREAERLRAEAERLATALEETNRALVRLYGELDDRASSLKRASDLKSRFLSNMSHEFRTPLNAIVSLTGLLKGQVDGPLTAEQEKQVAFIRKAADGLSRMVDDLLDLARIEAGKTNLRVETFGVEELFVELKGMMRPLQRGDDVHLRFVDRTGGAPLETDHGKVAQILRNLVANALKFTEHGEVKVEVDLVDDGRVRFAVTDTGIGIDPLDHERIFDEFAQIDSPTQRRVKGSGIGLPLSRGLARVLGGTLTVESQLGRGSTFTLVIPARAPAEQGERPPTKLDPNRVPVLVVEDDIDTLFLYERHLRGSGFQVVPARSLDEARAAVGRVRPGAIILDVLLERESSWDLLAELKREAATRDIPVIVVSVLDGRQHALALGAEEFCSKPVDQGWLVNRLQVLALKGPLKKALVIDDEEISRYLMKGFLAGMPFQVVEAKDGREGIERAQAESPDVIFLDLVLPDLTAFDVMGALKQDPRTRAIPIIVNTSKNLEADERRRLAESAVEILSKAAPSRQAAVSRIQEALAKAGMVTTQGARS